MLNFCPTRPEDDCQHCTVLRDRVLFFDLSSTGESFFFRNYGGKRPVLFTWAHTAIVYTTSRSEISVRIRSSGGCHSAELSPIAVYHDDGADSPVSIHSQGFELVSTQGRPTYPSADGAKFPAYPTRDSA